MWNVYTDEIGKSDTEHVAFKSQYTVPSGKATLDIKFHRFNRLIQNYEEQ